MFLFPTTTMLPGGDGQAEVEVEITVDLDKVAWFVNGGQGLTGLMLESGVNVTIRTPYLEVMEMMADADDEPPPPPPRKRK